MTAANFHAALADAFLRYSLETAAKRSGPEMREAPETIAELGCATGETQVID